MNPRISQQFEFIREIDRLKSVLRHTKPIGLDRRENSAEHSWHVILMAITLAEYAKEPIDLLSVVKMLALHDLVEIDAGDTFHYAKSSTEGLQEKEIAAAKRIFALLPADQSTEFFELWTEFENRQTPESKFAHCVDRIAAFWLNIGNQGGTWTDHQIELDLIIQKNQHAYEGSEMVWEAAKEMVADFFKARENPS
jgi:putative hydrolases of HD superfamily